MVGIEIPAELMKHSMLDLLSVLGWPSKAVTGTHLFVHLHSKRPLVQEYGRPVFASGCLLELSTYAGFLSAGEQTMALTDVVLGKAMDLSASQATGALVVCNSVSGMLSITTHGLSAAMLTCQIAAPRVRNLHDPSHIDGMIWMQ